MGQTTLECQTKIFQGFHRQSCRPGRRRTGCALLSVLGSETQVEPTLSVKWMKRIQCVYLKCAYTPTTTVTHNSYQQAEGWEVILTGAVHRSQETAQSPEMNPDRSDQRQNELHISELSELLTWIFLEVTIFKRCVCCFYSPALKLFFVLL